MPACRSCAGPLPPPGLSLGDQPLVDVAAESAEAARAAPRAPLALTLCPRCGLAQLAGPTASGPMPDPGPMPGSGDLPALDAAPDPNAVVSAIAGRIGDDGSALLEFPYLGDLVDRMDLAAVRHGRVSYLSMTSLVGLLERHGLGATAVERDPSHGGALRVRVERPAGRDLAAPVAALVEEERGRGMADPDYLAAFGARVAALLDDLLALLASLRSEEGALVAGHGAVAGATTLLNALRASADDVAFVADHRPEQQGRFIPGPGIPIVPPQELLDGRPDVLVVFTWSAADEVFERYQALRAAGTRFVVPVPEVRIL